jgi:hypothetical protein
MAAQITFSFYLSKLYQLLISEKEIRKVHSLVDPYGRKFISFKFDEALKEQTPLDGSIVQMKHHFWMSSLVCSCCCWRWRSWRGRWRSWSWLDLASPAVGWRWSFVVWNCNSHCPVLPIFSRDIQDGIHEEYLPVNGL